MNPLIRDDLFTPLYFILTLFGHKGAGHFFTSQGIDGSCIYLYI